MSKKSKAVLTKKEYLANREENLKSFSEGNFALYNLLDYCWSNNVTTIGCYADKTPYITFLDNEPFR